MDVERIEDVRSIKRIWGAMKPTLVVTINGVTTTREFGSEQELGEFMSQHIAEWRRSIPTFTIHPPVDTEAMIEDINRRAAENLRRMEEQLARQQEIFERQVNQLLESSKRETERLLGRYKK